MDVRPIRVLCFLEHYPIGCGRARCQWLCIARVAKDSIDLLISIVLLGIAGGHCMPAAIPGLATSDIQTRFSLYVKSQTKNTQDMGMAT